MTPEQARRHARTAGIVTLVAGPALLTFPDRMSRITGVTDPRLLRLIGITDITLAPGLLLAPGRWQWLAARAGANALAGARLVREPSRVAKGAGVTLLALILLDGRSAATLRRETRPGP